MRFIVDSAYIARANNRHPQRTHRKSLADSLDVTGSQQTASGSVATSLTGTEDTPVMAKCSGAVQFDVLSLTGTQVSGAA
jgi:hypothetical protein